MARSRHFEVETGRLSPQGQRRTINVFECHVCFAPHSGYQSSQACGVPAFCQPRCLSGGGRTVTPRNLPCDGASRTALTGYPRSPASRPSRRYGARLPLPEDRQDDEQADEAREQGDADQAGD
jgi:hypothetical protein